MSNQNKLFWLVKIVEYENHMRPLYDSKSMNIRLIILSIYFICCKLISIAYHQSNTSKTNKTNEHTNKQKQNKQKQMLDNVHSPVNINQWYNKGPPTNILLNCSNNIFCSIITQCSMLFKTISQKQFKVTCYLAIIYIK